MEENDAEVRPDHDPGYNRPSIPNELWGLWNVAGGDWQHPIDSFPTEDEAMLVFRTRDDAIEAARYHNEQSETACVAVRIK